MKKTLFIFSILALTLAPGVSFAISVTDPVIYLDENLQGQIVCDNPESETIFIYVFNADGIAHNATECADPDIVTLYNPAGHIPGYNVQFNSPDIGSSIRAGESIYVVEANFSENEFCSVSFSDCTTLGDIIGSANIPVYATAGAVGPVIGFPPVVPALTARISDTMGDDGLITVVVFIIALPVVFWIIARVRALFPQNK